MKTDIVIAGCGVSGLYCALKLPRDRSIVMITKDAADKSDSFLAQGGICMLRGEEDYDSYFEDTLRAGHYENNRVSVDIMLRSSQEVIGELVEYGARFERDEKGFVFTREGAHSRPRILFHEDETGKEITSHLLERVRELDNVTLIEYCTMVDIIVENGECRGLVVRDREGGYSELRADYTVLATGGIGGLYEHSTNFPHLTGDALAVSLKHGVALKNIDYIQIHPTTLYTEKKGREFLISESVRGEGAILLDKNGERFTNELQPRDVVTEAIYAQMKKDGTKFVRLSMERIPEHEIRGHFPHIYEHCLGEGYDVTREPIPVVPSQHYFMGGIDVNSSSKTSMERLYAVGETACNGVHGRNRLASNSLLESLVFAKRAAQDIMSNYTNIENNNERTVDGAAYDGCAESYRAEVLHAIEEERSRHE